MLVVTRVASTTVGFLGIVAAGPILAANAPPGPDFSEVQSWTPVLPWLSLGAIVGYATEGENWAASRGDATLFAPLSQDQSQLLFLQLDGRYFFDPEAEEGNAALGYRGIGDGVVHGLFASYDLNNSPNDNVFQQITLGGELLGPAWDARANVYLPLTGPQSAPGSADVVISGNSIAMVGGQEVPLASAQWDEARGAQFEVGVRLRVPLGAANAAPIVDPLRARLPERIVRDPDIVLGQSAAEKVRDVLTDVVFEQVEYSTDLSGGDLGAAAADAQMNSLLIVDEDFTGKQVIDGDGGLISNLTVAGEGGTFTVAGVNSGTEVEYTLPGARRTIMATATPGDDVAALTIIGDGGGDGSITDDGIGEGVHLVGLDVTATAEDMAGFQDVDGMYVFRVETPLYLEDMTIKAMGTLGSSGATAFVQGLDSLRNTGGLTILDSDIAALLDRGANGDRTANLYGLRDAGGTVNIVNSRVHADLEGGVHDAAEANLRGLFAENGGTFTIDHSNIFATLNGDVTGGSGGTDDEATAAVHGIYADRGGTFDIADSRIFAKIIGDLLGGSDGEDNPATGLVQGIHANLGAIFDITNSEVLAKMDGDVMGGESGTGNRALVNLVAVNALADTDVDIVGSDVSAFLDGNLTGGSEGDSNAAVANVFGLLADNAAGIRIDDSGVRAILAGTLTAGDGQSNSASAHVFGLNSSGAFLIDIDDSMISANVTGDFVAGGGTSFNSAGVNLSGILGSNGTELDIDTSAVSGTVTGNFWGGSGGTNNIASANVAGVQLSEAAARIHDGSTVLAAVDGNLQGGATGAVNYAHVNVQGVVGSDGGLVVEDSSVGARLSGNLDSGPGADASALLGAVAHLGAEPHRPVLTPCRSPAQPCPRSAREPICPGRAASRWGSICLARSRSKSCLPTTASRAHSPAPAVTWS